MSSPITALIYIFWTFFIIGMLTFGGGYGMIPIMQHDFVIAKGWMSDTEFKDAVAIGLVTPGPVAIIATFIGYRLHSWLGAIMATLGIFAPSIIIVYLAGKFFERFEKSIIAKRLLTIINSAVIGLLCAAIIALGKPSVTDLFTLILAISTFAIITWTRISPIWTILVCGFLGLIFF